MRRRAGKWGGRTILASLLTSLLSLFTHAATWPPRYSFQTLESGRIRIHFHREVEQPARRSMALVLEILPRLESRYRVHVPSLDVVVHDANDSPNGLATSFPYPAVEIRVASSDGADSGPTESWLREVVTHELTHIVHIEQARGIYGFGRRVFGRAPFLFPDALQPTWFIEGLAVREETRGDTFGRGRHTFTKMVVDEAARAGQLARMDQASLGLDRWPLGNAPYLFGEEFLKYVETKHGDDAVRDISIAQATSFRPYVDGPAFLAVTGQGLASLWRDFANARSAGLRPLSAPDLLTHRGAVQIAPRLSPDRSWLAYTSRTLSRRGEIRLMKPDGTSDHRLTWRLSGAGLAWSRDGEFLVFDETNQVRKFESRSDLYRVDLATGRRRRLTTGLRASEPDLDPRGGASGGAIVFVQRFADRSELSVRGNKGEVRTLTQSPSGTEWSHPRFSPSGDTIVAARLEGGFLDLVLVDPATGVETGLTHDRAVDAEPSWVDESRVIFRSDREADSFRLFLVNRDGSHLVRIDASPENAFVPEVDARSGTIFYAHYSADGYDLARAPFREGSDVFAYVDTFPAAFEDPVPFAGKAAPYRAARALGPRFVSPYAEFVSHEWRLGLATAAADPLLRLTWGLAGSWGTSVSKANGLAYLRYDRFVPTVTAVARVESSPSAGGPRDLAEGRVSVDFPIERSVLRSQTLDLTVRRRREDRVDGPLDTGLVSLGFRLDSTRAYPMSISPQDGVRLNVSLTREIKALGSDLNFGKAVVDGAAYTRVGRTVIATRLGFAWTLGSGAPRQAFGVGGLASPALLDPVGDEPAVLRGYESPDGSDESRYGQRLAFSNVEWRIPLAHPQRGVRAFPFFLRHVSLTAGIDAAAVSRSAVNLHTARVGASLGLSFDVLVGHRIPLTLQGGFGRGLTRDGSTVPWVSLGFPF